MASLVEESLAARLLAGLAMDSCSWMEVGLVVLGLPAAG